MNMNRLKKVWENFLKSMNTTTKDSEKKTSSSIQYSKLEEGNSMIVPEEIAQKAIEKGFKGSSPITAGQLYVWLGKTKKIQVKLGQTGDKEFMINVYDLKQKLLLFKVAINFKSCEEAIIAGLDMALNEI